MARLAHGKIVNIDPVAAVAVGAAGTAALAVDLLNFDFLFPELQDDPDNLLLATAVPHLKALAATMVDPNLAGQPDPAGNSAIPAVYTYLGQFIDHDITLEAGTAALNLGAGNLAPLPVGEIRNVLKNKRTATLDLDSLYADPAPRDPTNQARMLIGTVTSLNGTAAPELRPQGKGNDNDLPRDPRNTDPKKDRAARIGDPRNDENTIISQLHVAFLKAHNRLVAEGRTFDQARSILRQHYQHIVVHDFLKRIADPAIVDDIVTNGNRHFNALAEPFFMPLEFSVAAYRFGHTMVRAGYDFNLNFNLTGDLDTFPASLDLLFTFTAVSGQLGFGGGNDTLPDNWIIEWDKIAGSGVGDAGRARRFNTQLAGPNDTALFGLTKVDGKPEVGLQKVLATRNLLRGFLLRMPTGQAVAEALGLPVLTAAQLEDVARAAGQEVALAAGGFQNRTPLWYYLLAEAAAHGGERLGPVGSTLVAEVLIGLVRRSADSILRVPGWLPVLPGGPAGGFEIADLLRFARVMDGGPASVYHTVVQGDTLSAIAAAKLGSAARWPEIFAANRVLLTRPDRILPGQKLALPTGPAVVPQLRFHVVIRGETLSKIAKDHLGNASRWPEVFRLNGSVLTDPDRIAVGQVLQLPPA